MYGDNYYAGVEYAGRRVTSTSVIIITIVEKAADKIVLFTRNVIGRMMTTLPRTTLVIKDQKIVPTSAHKEDVLITKNGKINL